MQQLRYVAKGSTHGVQFEAWSEVENNPLEVVFQESGVDSDGDGLSNTVYLNNTYYLGRDKLTCQMSFTPTSSNSASAMKFFFGPSILGGKIHISNIQAKKLQAR